MSEDPRTEPVSPDQLKHGQVYLTHTDKGRPSLLVSPTRLRAPMTLPGWFAIYMDDETELYKFAASLMNKADEMAALRAEGKFGPREDEEGGQ